MEIAAFQDVLRRTYVERDTERGVDRTFRWLTEKVGEARALRGDGVLEAIESMVEPGHLLTVVAH